jgi:hypothetical protein
LRYFPNKDEIVPQLFGYPKQGLDSCVRTSLWRLSEEKSTYLYDRWFGAYCGRRSVRTILFALAALPLDAGIVQNVSLACGSCVAAVYLSLPTFAH